jgi:hypothetical protein
MYLPWIRDFLAKIFEVIASTNNLSEQTLRAFDAIIKFFSK